MTASFGWLSLLLCQYIPNVRVPWAPIMKLTEHTSNEKHSVPPLTFLAKDRSNLQQWLLIPLMYESYLAQKNDSIVWHVSTRKRLWQILDFMCIDFQQWLHCCTSFFGYRYYCISTHWIINEIFYLILHENVTQCKEIYNLKL